MMILIGVKFYYIQQKISAVTEADRLYALKDLIGAEEWYHKAHKNKSIQYKEPDISSRLTELAPISEINSKLSEIDKNAKRASDDGDFEILMTVYRDLEVFRGLYMKDGNTYAPYYRQISAKYEVSDDFTAYFQHFKTVFYQQMEHNLDTKKYSNESFKWNLLTIPDAFFGDADLKKTQLYDKFKVYDHRKMAQIAASGEYQTLLDESLAMLKLYDAHQIKADWITDQSDLLARTFLENDATNESYAIFATHAKSYNAFVQVANFKSSVEPYITKQISTWMKAAKRNVSKNEFENAIAIYEGLADYKDTTLEVKEAQLAWNIHDPIRILQSSDPTRIFTSISSGSKRFGASVYVLALDEQNSIYFARMNKDESVQVLSNNSFQHDGNIQDIFIEDSLSTKAFPVILIQGESTSRNALFTAIEVRTDEMVTLFQIHADGYQVDDNGQLLVDNPDTIEGPSQVAIYQRSGDSYSFVGVQQDFIDISVEDLILYMHDKVKFSTTIIQPGYSEAFAIMDDSYVKLTGSYDFYEGSISVTGIFSRYEYIYVQDELISIPVFEVESME
ncbi:hypothetical protein ACP8HI_20560 [Paenibacillus sp. FA6]|uniref:hypothetical protein n=1 Tax=Paenibacillus sp. FA6 TaxID=3413029 RepID=UPI003F65B6A2